MLAGQQTVGDGSECKYVGGRADILFCRKCLLGRHVTRSTDRNISESSMKPNWASDAKIRDLEHFRVARPTAKHVGGRKISVHHADRMDFIEAAGECQYGACCSVWIERIPRLVDGIDDPFVQS